MDNSEFWSTILALEGFISEMEDFLWDSFRKYWNMYSSARSSPIHKIKSQKSVTLGASNPPWIENGSWVFPNPIEPGESASTTDERRALFWWCWRMRRIAVALETLRKYTSIHFLRDIIWMGKLGRETVIWFWHSAACHSPYFKSANS